MQDDLQQQFVAETFEKINKLKYSTLEKNKELNEYGQEYYGERKEEKVGIMK